MAETDKCSACSDGSSSGGTCYICTWNPLLSPATVPKSASEQRAIMTLNGIAQKPSAGLCVPSRLHSLCFRLAVLVAYRCAV